MGWPTSLLVLLAGYHKLLQAAGLSGAGITAVMVLATPFAVFLTIGANTWVLGAVAAARRTVPKGLRWPESSSSVTDSRVATAIVFPIKNEDTAEVFANVAAIAESLCRADAQDLFDIYVISNSDDPDCWVEEELAWHAVSRTFGRIYYWRRHREQGRKPANIAEFCERWGAGYEYMVTMDADSLMSAECLLSLVELMQANPAAALMQTAPDIIKGRTLWARLQQFTIWSNARIVQWGERVWQGGAGAYYGHNAIIRIAPFMQHCGLPMVPGRPPFGGEILSHDFVEAALLSRAGWQVWLVPELEGSYEQCPPTFDEYFRRDRRWFQGDFVNFRLIGTSKLPQAGRIRFAMAAMRDVSTPLLLLLCGLIIAMAHAPGYGAAAIFVPLLVWDFAARQSWAGVPAVGFGIAVRNRSISDQRVPVWSSLGNRVLDQVLWLATTPTRLLTHALFVVELGYGRDVGWTTLRRTTGMSTRSQSLGLYFAHTAFGACVAATLFFTDSWALWWLSPMWMSWICTVPIARTFASERIAALTRRARILLIPEEADAPPIITRSGHWAQLIGRELPSQPWRAALTEDTAIAVHQGFLAHAAPMTPQQRAAAATAAEKYCASATPASELTDREKNALLRDPHHLWAEAPPVVTIDYPQVRPTPMPEQPLVRT
ncbi:glucans biosynthesis glucosyltransferase MdoH [Nocardia vaccinii]|uniref:glucans biosynthesis glucosyltransferase MdoH n=1 Tax=Nocardia vaccinii TaxID=1822 RepID=UPI0008345CFA|nr:glucans biosynthesis glucosyltransferase MdoH [Nocardia vaccinii]